MGLDIDIDVQEHFDKLDAFLESAQNNQSGVVIFDTPYALYVEYPTEYTSKKPPFEPIFEWVKRNVTTDNPRETAFRIQNHIFENGTEGVFFLNRTKTNHENYKGENIIDSYNGPIEDAPENILTELLESILEDAEDIIADEAVDTRNLLESGFYELNPDDELLA